MFRNEVESKEVGADNKNNRNELELEEIVDDNKISPSTGYDSTFFFNSDFASEFVEPDAILTLTDNHEIPVQPLTTPIPVLKTEEIEKPVAKNEQKQEESVVYINQFKNRDVIEVDGKLISKCAFLKRKYIFNGTQEKALKFEKMDAEIRGNRVYVNGKLIIRDSQKMEGYRSYKKNDDGPAIKKQKITPERMVDINVLDLLTQSTLNRYTMKPSINEQTFFYRSLTQRSLEKLKPEMTEENSNQPAESPKTLARGNKNQ